jgi:hypothetical protein
MTKSLLLPHKCKKIGWILLIPATIMGFYLTITDFEGLPIYAKVFALFNNELINGQSSFSVIETNITNTIVGVIFIVGALLVGFSKEKTEDEFISNLRLSSLLWAVWVSYILLLLSFLFIYGTAFFDVMLYNMFTVLIIFIVRFNYILYKNIKAVSGEK